MSGRLSGADFAARRHLIGLTLEEVAGVLGVNPRTARAWETGRDLIPERVGEELGALIDEHTALAERMVDSEGVVGIVRDKGAADMPHPRGWYVAAAARALLAEPDLMVDWV